jgi:hypothetical protein
LEAFGALTLLADAALLHFAAQAVLLATAVVVAAVVTAIRLIAAHDARRLAGGLAL